MLIHTQGMDFLPNTDKTNSVILAVNNSLVLTPEAAAEAGPQLTANHTSGHTHGQRYT